MAEEPVKTECFQTDPKIQVYNFSKIHIDKIFHFQVLKLDGSLFLWIGCANHSMSSLCVAMNTKYDNVPAITALLGDPINISCGSLAQRLAKKTEKQCFLSYNGTMDKASLTFVEHTITQEIKEKPQYF